MVPCKLQSGGCFYPSHGQIEKRSFCVIRKLAISPARFWAMVVKEFIQMGRDKLTFGIMVGIPLIQLTLFGFAINSDPKHLPAALILSDNGPQSRTVLNAFRNSTY